MTASTIIMVMQMAKRKGKVNRMKKGFLQATNYLNTHLNEGEVPIYRAHLSWIPVFTRQIPFMIIGGILGGIAWGSTGDFVIGSGIFTGAFIIGALSQIHRIYVNIATDILLTNQGIHMKENLIAVENNKFARYNRINDAELNYRSILQRAFDYGDVAVITIGGAPDDSYDFKGVAKAGVFQEAVRTAITKYNSPMIIDQAMGARPQRSHNGRGRNRSDTNSNRAHDDRRGRGARKSHTLGSYE